MLLLLKDAVLAGYKERVERAMEENAKWKVYLGKQQAQKEWEKLVEQQKDYLTEEEARGVMVAYFKGTDLRYCGGS